MKEAFELIRKRMREELTLYEKAIQIVSEVEAEFEKDVCVWHKVRNGNAYKCDTHAEIYDSRVLDWWVCPYCEKKIKVVE